MAASELLITIFGMALVTQLLRLAPLWFLAGRELPEAILTWLKYVPVAVLSAMVLPELVVKHQALDFTRQNLALWIALPTFAIGLWTRNIFLTVVFGMAGLALARLAVI